MSTTEAPGGSPEARSGGPVLDVQRVCAGYGPYRALFDVSFSVPEGGIVALLGSNGSGKSTVARVVTGLVAATEGRIVVCGHDVTRWPAWRIARCGVTHVPEGRGVLGSLTVEENLVLVFRQRTGRRKVAEALARTYEAFPVLADRRKQPAGTLSGGQQRILSLAKVLAVPQRLLVADELSLGLAPVIVDQVYDGLRRINAAGTALLAVEQQVDRVLELASRAVVLEHGHVAYEGDAAGARRAIEQIMAVRAERLDAGARQVDWGQVRESRRSRVRR